MGEKGYTPPDIEKHEGEPGREEPGRVPCDVRSDLFGNPFGSFERQYIDENSPGLVMTVRAGLPVAEAIPAGALPEISHCVLSELLLQLHEGNLSDETKFAALCAAYRCENPLAARVRRDSGLAGSDVPPGLPAPQE